MNNHRNRIAVLTASDRGRIFVFAVISVMAVSCGTYPPEPPAPENVAGQAVESQDPVACGPVQPSTREQLVQWVEMTRQENPELVTDVSRWIQMTQESLKPAPKNDSVRRERLKATPTEIFGMATITVFPALPVAADETKDAGQPPAFECNGLTVHAKVNGRVFIETATGRTEAGFVNLDSGLDYIVIEGRVTLETRIKVDFPGNSIWEPMTEEFVLRERIHADRQGMKGRACDVFVLGSEKKDELVSRREPDRTVVPDLMELVQYAPSRYTRGLAAIHLGIIKDSTAFQAMLDAFTREQDADAKADMALGLAIFGDTAALEPIEKESERVMDQKELGWKYREAINRLKGLRH